MKRNGELESENLESKLKEIEKRLKRIEELEGVKNAEKLEGEKNAEKLEGVKNAEKLEGLNFIEELKGLKHAQELERLNFIEELERVKNAQELERVKNAQELEGLNLIEELKGLKHAQELEGLNLIEELERVKRAEKLGVNMNQKNNNRKRGFQNTRNVSGSQLPAKDTGLVEEIAKGFMPGLEKIIKRMEEVSPEFRVRIEETDQDIKHRLDKQWTFRPGISAGYSLDTVKGRRKAAELKIKPEIEPIFDIIKEKDYIYVTVQVPNEEECRIKPEMDCNVLRIASGDYFQTMELPEKTGPVVEQTFRNGVLQLKIKRQKYVD